MRAERGQHVLEDELRQQQLLAGVHLRVGVGVYCVCVFFLLGGGVGVDLGGLGGSGGWMPGWLIVRLPDCLACVCGRTHVRTSQATRPLSCTTLSWSTYPIASSTPVMD